MIRFAAMSLFAALLGGAPVTFHKDVAPVLQNNCQGCHRTGEAAPMAFGSYKEVRPWAKAIKASVLARKMPPWFADPAFGKFHNERRLSDADLRTIVAWVDAGAPEGNPADAPKPAAFLEGWNIGKPDLEIGMPASYNVPASGAVEYTYVIVPTGLKQDAWVQAAEVRPGSRSVVHHVIAFIREPGSKWFRDYPAGEPFVPKARAAGGRQNNDGETAAELLVGYAPGLPPAVLQAGTAKLLKAGTDVVFQLHYTTNGKAASDQTKIGLVFAKEPPKERVMTLAAMNRKFAIPPGAAAHEVKSQFTVRSDARLIGLMPHMHLRGKDFLYQAVYPTGEKETLLSVPKYDFNWQLWYYLAEPKLMPKGTRLECTAHFDNSANNPANPDPSKEVRWGDQSWEEMMIGWFDVAFDRAMDPAKLFKESD
jgi:hypothetical protein